jgi:Ser/Thr protein kinase RdoA (MazF antagonist)
VEARIRDRYTDDMRRQAFARHGAVPEGARELDGFESFIYEFHRNGRPYILRVGHTLRRPVELVRGEIDWINYLADGGAAVARAVPSVDGRLVETIADGAGDQFLATAFGYANGSGPHGEAQLVAIAEAYGQAIGRMHALTKTYEPSDPAWTRMQWDDPNILDAWSWLPETDSVVLDRVDAVVAHIRDLPRDRASYGLVHQDAHGGNFHIADDGQLTFFDFDDCCYSWFVDDIAIVLFYAALFTDDPPAFTGEFLPRFLRGYARENTLDVMWLSEIPHFLKLREIDLYAVIHRSFDVADLTDPWVAAYMRGRKERIESGAPVLDLDFACLSSGA